MALVSASDGDTEGTLLGEPDGCPEGVAVVGANVGATVLSQQPR